jgi:uncharacterized protein (DUF3084 family)
MKNDLNEGQNNIQEYAAEIKSTDKDLKAMEAKVANTIENRRQLMNDRNKEMNNMEAEDFDFVLDDSSELAKFFKNSF